MKSRIEFIPELCVGCGACAIACMDQNDITAGAGDVQFRTVFTTETISKGKCILTSFSLSCLHCEDAPCVQGCPTGCLRKDPDGIMTIYDKSLCIGCHSCVMACPYGVPSFDNEGKISKCNGCYVRVAHGYLPACVRTCPTEALRFCSVEEISKEKKNRTMRRMLEDVCNE